MAQKIKQKTKLDYKRRKRSLYRDIESVNQQQVQAAIKVAADAQKDKKERGLYGKYYVRRVDGGNEPGKKHAKCEYFVLDITHDPHAAPAVFSYARSAGADGYKQLEADLYSKIQPFIKQLNEQAVTDADKDIEAGANIKKMTDEKLLLSISNLWATLDDFDALILQELIERYGHLATKPKRTRKKKIQVNVTAENSFADLCISNEPPVSTVAEVVKVARKKKLL